MTLHNWELICTDVGFIMSGFLSGFHSSGKITTALIERVKYDKVTHEWVVKTRDHKEYTLAME